MEWWRWGGLVAGCVCVLLLLALRFDTLKDRRGSDARRAARRLSPWLGVFPVVVLATVLGPWWLVAAAVGLPALTLLAMASID